MSDSVARLPTTKPPSPVDSNDDSNHEVVMQVVPVNFTSQPAPTPLHLIETPPPLQPRSSRHITFSDNGKLFEGHLTVESRSLKQLIQFLVNQQAEQQLVVQDLKDQVSTMKAKMAKEARMSRVRPNGGERDGSESPGRSVSHRKKVEAFMTLWGGRPEEMVALVEGYGDPVVTPDAYTQFLLDLPAFKMTRREAVSLSTQNKQGGGRQQAQQSGGSEEDMGEVAQAAFQALELARHLEREMQHVRESRDAEAAMAGEREASSGANGGPMVDQEARDLIDELGEYVNRLARDLNMNQKEGPQWGKAPAREEARGGRGGAAAAKAGKGGDSKTTAKPGRGGGRGGAGAAREEVDEDELEEQHRGESRGGRDAKGGRAESRGGRDAKGGRGESRGGRDAKGGRVESRGGGRGGREEPEDREEREAGSRGGDRDARGGGDRNRGGDRGGRGDERGPRGPGGRGERGNRPNPAPSPDDADGTASPDSHEIGVDVVARDSAAAALNKINDLAVSIDNRMKDLHRSVAQMAQSVGAPPPAPLADDYTLQSLVASPRKPVQYNSPRAGDRGDRGDRRDRRDREDRGAPRGGGGQRGGSSHQRGGQRGGSGDRERSDHAEQQEEYYDGLDGSDVRTSSTLHQGHKDDLQPPSAVQVPPGAGAALDGTFPSKQQQRPADRSRRRQSSRGRAPGAEGETSREIAQLEERQTELEDETSKRLQTMEDRLRVLGRTIAGSVSGGSAPNGPSVDRKAREDACLSLMRIQQLDREIQQLKRTVGTTLPGAMSMSTHSQPRGSRRSSKEVSPSVAMAYNESDLCDVPGVAVEHDVDTRMEEVNRAISMLKGMPASRPAGTQSSLAALIQSLGAAAGIGGDAAGPKRGYSTDWGLANGGAEDQLKDAEGRPVAAGTAPAGAIPGSIQPTPRRPFTANRSELVLASHEAPHVPSVNVQNQPPVATSPRVLLSSGLASVPVPAPSDGVYRSRSTIAEEGTAFLEGMLYKTAADTMPPGEHLVSRLRSPNARSFGARLVDRSVVHNSPPTVVGGSPGRRQQQQLPKMTGSGGEGEPGKNFHLSPMNLTSLQADLAGSSPSTPADPSGGIHSAAAASGHGPSAPSSTTQQHQQPLSAPTRDLTGLVVPPSLHHSQPPPISLFAVNSGGEGELPGGSGGQRSKQLHDELRKRNGCAVANCTWCDGSQGS